jgi:hypothetical protein
MFIVNAWKLQTVVKEAVINTLSLTNFCFAVLQKVMWFIWKLWQASKYFHDTCGTQIQIYATNYFGQ